MATSPPLSLLPKISSLPPPPQKKKDGDLTLSFLCGDWMWRERTLGPLFCRGQWKNKVVYYTQDGKAKGLTERVASMLGFICKCVFSVDQCPKYTTLLTFAKP